MSIKNIDSVSIAFDRTQLEFLRQLVESDAVTVTLKNARVAGQVHGLVVEAAKGFPLSAETAK